MSSLPPEITEMNSLHGQLIAQRERVPIEVNTSRKSKSSLKSSAKQLRQSVEDSLNRGQSKKAKKLKCDCALASMCFITILSNSAYALIAPFLPIELLKLGVPVSMFGYIFSMYSLAVIICSPLVGYLLTKIHRRSFV